MHARGNGSALNAQARDTTTANAKRQSLNASRAKAPMNSSQRTVECYTQAAMRKPLRVFQLNVGKRRMVQHSVMNDKQLTRLQHTSDPRITCMEERGGDDNHSPDGAHQLDEIHTNDAPGRGMAVSEHAVGAQGHRGAATTSAVGRPHGSALTTPRPSDPSGVRLCRGKQRVSDQPRRQH